MEKKVTIYTLAEKLNMSVSAVSRAFTPNSKLNAEKRKIILEAAEKYGYVQNKMASRLSQNPFHIGVIMRGRIEAYYHQMRMINAPSEFKTQGKFDSAIIKLEVYC